MLVAVWRFTSYHLSISHIQEMGSHSCCPLRKITTLNNLYMQNEKVLSYTLNNSIQFGRKKRSLLQPHKLVSSYDPVLLQKFTYSEFTTTLDLYILVHMLTISRSKPGGGDQTWLVHPSQFGLYSCFSALSSLTHQHYLPTMTKLVWVGVPFAALACMVLF